MEALVVLGLDEGSEPFVSFHGGLHTVLSLLSSAIEDILGLADSLSGSSLRVLHSLGDSFQFFLLFLGLSVDSSGREEARLSISNVLLFSTDS